MANKKVSQLTSKPSVLTTDLVPIADPSTGQLFKTTLSALGAVIGSAVASVNGLVGVVVLDTDDIQELASPTNKWFTDTRARAALSAGTGISYNSGTGVISSSVTLAGLGGVPTSRTLTINGTAFDLSADRSWSINSMVYPGAGIPISTGTAWGTSITNNSDNWNTAYGWGNHAGLYLPIGGGTLTGALSGTSGSFSGDITANSFIKSGGTSSGFLKADGSVDVRTFVTTGALDNYLPLTGGSLTNSLSSGYVLSITNTTEAAGANGLYVNIASGSTGTPFRVDRAGVSLITVNYLGATLFKSTVTANQFIKANGTSSEYLMADGSVSTGPSFTYPGAGIVVSTGSAWGTSITNNSNNWNTAFSWGNHAGLYLSLSGGTLTGALSGTSATFSGSVGINGGDFRYRPNGDVANSPALVLKSPTSGVLSLCAEVVGDANVNSNSLSLRVSNPDLGRFDALIIAPTGAATFSSSVTAGGLTIKNPSVDGSAAAISIRDTSNVYEIGYLNFNQNTDMMTLMNKQGYSASGIAFGTNNTERMRINVNGNVGIGTTAPGAMLHINQNASDIQLILNSNSTTSPSITQYRINNSSGWEIGMGSVSNSYSYIFSYGTFGTSTAKLTLTNGGALTLTGSVTATSFFESSDSRLKTLIKDNYQAKGIESITAKLYTKNGVTELGYYAQDVQSILPSAVTIGDDGFLNLSYREVHTAKIARLEKEVEELKAQLNLI